MPHLPIIINDLAIILGVAAIVSIIFKKLRQPVVLGYILAGLLVSPNIPFLPSITDHETIKLWAEIGVIFLLFGLGLEFSFRRLWSIGPSAGIAGLFEVSCIMAIGFTIGHLLGWNQINSLFLGGILCISSTTIILRTLEEKNLKKRNFATMVFGILIIEDLVAVILLVILSTISVTRQFQGNELLFSALKLSFFLILWFITGMFFIPTLLEKAKGILNEETMLIVCLGLCLGMVLLANSAGFSPALGAFIMGSLLAETAQGPHIEKITKPVKDLFGAIFFVSVGMLINLSTLVEEWKMVILLSLTVLGGKAIFVTLGSLIAGQPLKRSVQAGFTMTQIGEFSFIMATLGQTLGVTDERLYPLAVAVSVTTTFTTPYFVAFSGTAGNWLETRLPPKYIKILNQYSSSSQVAVASGPLKKSLQFFLVHIVIKSTLIIGVTLLGQKFIHTKMMERIESQLLVNIFTFLVTLIISTPFYWALLHGRINHHINVFQPLKRMEYMGHALSVIRYLTVVTLLGLQVSIFFSGIFATSALIILGLLAYYFFHHQVGEVYEWMEGKFLRNMASREVHGEARVTLETPWEGHMSYFEISPDFAGLGKTISELAVREIFGVTIAMLERGKRKIAAPQASEKIYPHDRLCVIGTDEQLEAFAEFLERNSKLLHSPKDDIQNFVLHPHYVGQSSPFRGKSIRNSGIREITFGLVVGLERSGSLTVNPVVQTILESGDLLWIAGDQEMLKELEQTSQPTTLPG